MIETLISLLIFLVIVAILWWALNSLGLPQPVRVVAIAIIAIVALVFLGGLLTGNLGGGRLFHIYRYR